MVDLRKIKTILVALHGPDRIQKIHRTYGHGHPDGSIMARGDGGWWYVGTEEEILSQASAAGIDVLSGNVNKSDFSTKE